ncbi:hypothetical protein R6Z07M_019500 [Ovis aries]
MQFLNFFKKFNIFQDHQLYRSMLLIVNLQCNDMDSSTGNLFLYNKNMSISFVHLFTNWIFMHTYCTPSMILGIGTAWSIREISFVSLLNFNISGGEPATCGYFFLPKGFHIPPKKLHMVVLLGSPFNRLMEKSIESFYCKLLSCQNSFLEQSGIEMHKQASGSPRRKTGVQGSIKSLTSLKGVAASWRGTTDPGGELEERSSRCHC